MPDHVYGNCWLFQALGETKTPHKCHLMIPDTVKHIVFSSKNINCSHLYHFEKKTPSPES